MAGATSDRDRRGVFLVVTAVALTSLLCLLVPPIQRDTSHLGRLVLAGAGVAIVALRGMFALLEPTRPLLLQGLRAALAAAVTAGAFNYWQFDRNVAFGINDWTDPAYYYTNSKYLKELSYDGLYAAALVCDRERGSPRTNHIRTIRDLRDDQLVPVAAGLAHGEEVARAFTPERWAAFCHDMTFFLDRVPRDSLEDNFFVDHGYNPPPTWTIVGGSLAELTPVEHLKLLCLVDVAVVGAAFTCVWWVFGAEVTGWALLFLFTTFSGRWPILGMSILRFDWLAALMIAMCLAKVGRPAGAGAAVAFAAVNRVFPAIFIAPWLANAVRDTVAARRVPVRHLRFAVAAALVTAALGGASLLRYGSSITEDAAQNLAMHNRSYSSHRVGLGSVLLFRGETTRVEINDFQMWCADPGERNGMARKEQCIQRLQLPLRGAALLAIGFLFLYAFRAKPEDWEILPLAILPFFCATNPQINYYNLRILLIMWHGASITRPFHRLGLAMLLLVEVVTQTTKVMGTERYATTATASIGMAIYLVVLVIWMARRAIRPNP